MDTNWISKAFSIIQQYLVAIGKGLVETKKQIENLQTIAQANTTGLRELQTEFAQLAMTVGTDSADLGQIKAKVDSILKILTPPAAAGFTALLSINDATEFTGENMSPTKSRAAAPRHRFKSTTMAPQQSPSTSPTKMERQLAG